MTSYHARLLLHGGTQCSAARCSSRFHIKLQRGANQRLDDCRNVISSWRFTIHATIQLIFVLTSCSVYQRQTVTGPTCGGLPDLEDSPSS
ncbi:hypothetical protein GQ600_3965 [Phytophthora cactorum]|nr:hypothetical protein GQ600_3965 [Phytophthora cactorum]